MLAGLPNHFPLLTMLHNGELKTVQFDLKVNLTNSIAPSTVNQG